jgi:hypothetical protein
MRAASFGPNAVVTAGLMMCFLSCVEGCARSILALPSKLK